MNRILLFVAATFICGSINAQSTAETVTMGEGYANDVWYSFEDGEQGQAPRDEWHLAFDASSFGTSIRINSSVGMQLWLYPGDVEDFETLDTTGLDSWQPLYNADTSWAYGAFSHYQNEFDIGWGEYNVVTHVVTGDSLYLAQLPSGEFQKIYIESLESGSYNFRHATLDNEMDMTHSIAKANFSEKNFAYFNLTTHSSIDREPDSESWDLLFTQYTAFIPIPYPVSGVLHNRGVEVAKAYPIDDPTTYNDYGSHEFQTEINTIGYDWKSFTGEWSLQDSLAYFVKTADGDIWKIYFTDFGGSGTGVFEFNKEKIFTSGVEENTELFTEIYPNPAREFVNVAIDSPSQETEIKIYDLSGKVINSQIFNGRGLQTHRLDVSSMEDGIYLLSAKSGQRVYSSKLIIQ